MRLQSRARAPVYVALRLRDGRRPLIHLARSARVSQGRAHRCARRRARCGWRLCGGVASVFLIRGSPAAAAAPPALVKQASSSVGRTVSANIVLPSLATYMSDEYYNW